MTVYVVTEGSYSDYGISCMFSTKEKAQAWIEQRKITCPSTDAGIDEWDVDACENEKAMQIFNAVIYLGDGHIYDRPPSMEVTSTFRGRVAFYKVFQFGEAHAYSTISQEHARKVAIEARQAYMRYGNEVFKQNYSNTLNLDEVL